MSADLIQTLTYVLLFAAFVFFMSKNDEFPFVLPLFMLSTGVMRYNAVTTGMAHWAVVAYPKIRFDYNEELALQALQLFFLGTATFFVSYVLFRAKPAPYRPMGDTPETFKTFLLSKRVPIFILFILFLLINAATKTVLAEATQTAYGMSYFFLFKLAIGGLILLFYMLYRSSDVSNTPLKILLLGLLAFSAYASYNPTSRFNFISWMIAAGIVTLRNMKPNKKILLYGIGGPVALIIFAMAGNYRHSWTRSLSFQEKLELAKYRLTITEDQNMLDGFMMVLQIYPNHLDYHMGMEHVEILMRPIPRAIWPEKPVGGYANKLGLNEGMPDGTTVGISQTIYGTFYGEGGVNGILIFSILYGAFFARLFIYAERYNSDVQYLIKGIVIASAIPILRGGDLPGVVAFVGMSYWPVFLFLYMYRKHLNQLRAVQPPSPIQENHYELSTTN